MIIKRNIDQIYTKRVSFIMATRNRAKFLGKNLSKIKPLITKNDELIVIDGNSTDKTLSVLKKHSSFIDLIISEPDLNPTHAANKGILLAKGKYIKFLSDDDIVYPKAMQKAIKLMDKNSSIDILVCGGTWTKHNSNETYVHYVPPGTNFGKTAEDVFEFSNCGQGYIIRKRSLAQTGLFDVNDFFSDISFLVQAIKTGACVKFARINLYHAYAHAGSVGGKHKKEVERSKLKTIKENANYKYFLRYYFNYLIRTYPILKLIFFLPILISRLFPKESTTYKKTLQWDNGLS